MFCHFVGVDFVEFGSEVGEEFARVHHNLTLTAEEVLHRVLTTTTEGARVDEPPLVAAGHAARGLSSREGRCGRRLHRRSRSSLSLLRRDRSLLGKGRGGSPVVSRGWVQSVVGVVVLVVL